MYLDFWIPSKTKMVPMHVCDTRDFNDTIILLYYRFFPVSFVILSTKFILWAFSLEDLSHAQPIRHSILFSQHLNLHWRHSNLNFCCSNPRKMQQVRKTVIQFKRCPDRWRIWMLSTRILIWMMQTLNFLTEVRIWMTEIQICTIQILWPRFISANLNDSFIKWNDKPILIHGVMPPFWMSKWPPSIIIYFHMYLYLRLP